MTRYLLFEGPEVWWHERKDPVDELALHGGVGKGIFPTRTERKIKVARTHLSPHEAAAVRAFDIEFNQEALRSITRLAEGKTNGSHQQIHDDTKKRSRMNPRNRIRDRRHGFTAGP
jgi:hypothetical protein